jgi:hypothetical protein
MPHQLRLRWPMAMGRSIQALALCLGLLAHMVHARDTSDTVYYMGGGASKPSTDAAFSVGFVSLPHHDGIMWGLDFGSEGVLSNTNPASTFNALIGKNIGYMDHSRLDAFLMIGGKTTDSSCPSAQATQTCNAEIQPSTTYGVNAGLALMWTHPAFMLGARLTGLSAQVLLGLKY